MEGLVEKRPGLRLMVKDLDEGQVSERRRSPFRQSAKPVAAVARQLGLSADEAVAVSAELVNGSKEQA